jgi:uncharacterized protein YndB with AHSA1/START domain
MTDISGQVEAIHRELGSRGDARTLTMRRTYDGSIEDVWDALTNPDRLKRWLLPVNGDFKVGGHYQLEGNAGGEILECEAPNRLKVTWIFGGATGLSEVEVTLTAESDQRTLFELEHVAEVPEEFWAQFGPGAVGIGWDLSLMSLAHHLAGEDISPEEGAQAEKSPVLREFMTGSGNAWATAHRASGADETEVSAALQGSLGFYIPDTGTQE